MPDSVRILAEDFGVLQLLEVGIDRTFLEARSSYYIIYGTSRIFSQYFDNTLLRRRNGGQFVFNICSRLLATKCDCKESFGGELRCRELGIKHVLLHSHDAGTNVLHKVHTCEEREDERIAGQTTMSEVLGHQRKEAAGIGDLPKFEIHGLPFSLGREIKNLLSCNHRAKSLVSGAKLYHFPRKRNLFRGKFRQCVENSMENSIDAWKIPWH